MKYYKLYTDEAFVGIVNSEDFLYENPRTHRLLTSNEISGQFVQCNNKLYRDYWMKPIETSRIFTNVNIREITEEEYNAFAEAIEQEEPIPNPQPEPTPSPLPVNNEEEVSIDYLRDAKIQEMSRMCNATIEAGFDLEVQGEMRHFSLTIQDQINLINLNTLAQTQQLIPYHADGEVSTFYTPDEINAIITEATTFKNYQLMYYNALKIYINALDTIEGIAAITYGIDIPEEYKTDVLKVLEY